MAPDKTSSDGVLPSSKEYDEAAEIAQSALDAALETAGDLDFLVAIMMIETAVNTAAELTSDEDVLRLLQDLVAQVEQSIQDSE